MCKKWGKCASSVGTPRVCNGFKFPDENTVISNRKVCFSLRGEAGVGCGIVSLPWKFSLYFIIPGYTQSSRTRALLLHSAIIINWSNFSAFSANLVRVDVCARPKMCVSFRRSQQWKLAPQYLRLNT